MSSRSVCGVLPPTVDVLSNLKSKHPSRIAGL